MGLLLRATAQAAPSPADPFLVVDRSLTVCAMSRNAERLLGVPEMEAVHRHIGEFLTLAEPDPSPAGDVGAALVRASLGQGPVRTVMVRPANTYGVRYSARIGSCGPPAAALLVLADAR